jgi:acetyl esterase/lipase
MVTILSRHPEAYTKVVLPRAHGYEERDVRAYPLPPNVRAEIVRVVCDELRAQGHTVTITSKREKLANWSETNRANERSFCSDEDWRPNPKGPVLIHFTGGGWDMRVQCDDRETRLYPEHLRMSRAMLRLYIAGHP